MAVKTVNGKIPVRPKNGSGNSKTLNIGAGSKKAAPLVGKKK